MEMVDDLRINMIRCWGGNVYENDLFYDLCDEQGVLVWQDFAMACSIYPQDAEFRSRLADEIRKVVRRLRQHPCIALWSGDNECDASYLWSGRNLDPNVLTRQVLPGVLLTKMRAAPFAQLTYIDSVAFQANPNYCRRTTMGTETITASITRGRCVILPARSGITAVRRFARFASSSAGQAVALSGQRGVVTARRSPVPGVNLYDYRVELMAKQVRELFGRGPTR